ncbi:MAG: hypothetical protein HY295_01055 [Thaumarchaeota archaeon]|nr:hypothetical protein [Nitrososphaerota archaeon]
MPFSKSRINYSKDREEKKVSIPWQIASLYIPIPIFGLGTAIYAFYRIQKFRYAIISIIPIMLLEIGLMGLYMTLAGINLLGVYVLGFFVPRICLSYLIYRWSKDWNKKIDSQPIQ